MTITSQHITVGSMAGTEYRADVAVVGTGVIGLAVAHELLGRGHAVAVIGVRPGHSLGQASAAAGAMLSMFSEIDPAQPQRRTALEVGYRCQAHQRYPSWLASIHAAGGSAIDLLPGTWVVATAGELSTLDAIAEVARVAGHPVERHAGTEVFGIQPDLPPAAALWLPSECSLDSAQLLAGLGSAVGGHRNARWVDEEATSVDTGRSAVRIRCSSGAVVMCDRVVLAAGIGIPALLPNTGVPLGVPPLLAGRGVSLLMSSPIAVGHTVRTPNSAFACGTHLVSRGTETVYLGATNRLSLAPQPHPVASLDEIATLIRDATSVLDTRLSTAGLRRIQVGYRPYTVDHLPLIGPTADPRILLATGTYRCGVLLAPLLAELLADEITTPRSLTDHPYRTERPMPTPRMDSILTRARIDGLIDHIGGATGQLTTTARRQLAAFLHGALTTTTDTTTHAALARLFEQAPVAEVLPSLLALAERLEANACRPPAPTAPRPGLPQQRESAVCDPTGSPATADSTSSVSTLSTASR